MTKGGKKKDVSTQGKDVENTERTPKAGRTLLSPQPSADSAFAPQRERSVPCTVLGAADGREKRPRKPAPEGCRRTVAGGMAWTGPEGHGPRGAFQRQVEEWDRSQGCEEDCVGGERGQGRGGEGLRQAERQLVSQGQATRAQVCS